MRKRPNDVEKLDQISQSINPDGKGNLTIGKNLGVDGKLKLKSLVSESNPDGDITKELGGGGGGGKIFMHNIIIKDYRENNFIGLNIYNNSETPFTISSLTTKINGHNTPCSGSFIYIDGRVNYIANYLYVYSNKLMCRCTDFVNNNSVRIDLHEYKLTDDVIPA